MSGWTARLALGAAWGLATALPGSAAPPADDLATSASRVFTVAHRLCQLDAGRMWGRSLCGPTMVADPATRTFIADADGERTRGALPDDVPIANTAFDWRGKHWSMLATPLPNDQQALAVLVMHEAWHRIQDGIGLPSVQVDEDQLDTADGRMSLRLELRALSAALGTSDPKLARRDIDAAWQARLWRQQRFPGSGAREDALERHEGVAEYTGRVLAGDPEMAAHLATRLQAGDREQAYARSFAYFTGPAYGALLDRFAPGWRAAWDKKTGLAPLLASRLGLPTTAPSSLADIGASFDIARIAAEERERTATREAEDEARRKLLVTGPVLSAPVKGASFGFDPTSVSPLPPYGSVYATIRAAADWGVLEVNGEGLLSPDWSRLTVSLAGSSRIKDGAQGKGWHLALKPGWTLVNGPRSGDLTISKD